MCIYIYIYIYVCIVLWHTSGARPRSGEDSQTYDGQTTPTLPTNIIPTKIA